MKRLNIVFIILGFLLSFSLQAQEIDKKAEKKSSSSKKQSKKSKESCKEMKAIDLDKSLEILIEDQEEPSELPMEKGNFDIQPESLPLPSESEAEPVPGAEIYLEQNPEEEVKPEIKYKKPEKEKKKVE